MICASQLFPLKSKKMTHTHAIFSEWWGEQTVASYKSIMRGFEQTQMSEPFERHEYKMWREYLLENKLSLSWVVTLRVLDSGSYTLYCRYYSPVTQIHFTHHGSVRMSGRNWSLISICSCHGNLWCWAVACDKAKCELLSPLWFLLIIVIIMSHTDLHPWVDLVYFSALPLLMNMLR